MPNLLDSLFPEGGWLAKAQRAYTGLGGTPDEVLGPRPQAREELSVPRGELLSPLASRLAALKSGADPVGNALLNFAGPIKAYHGSPHLFDKFSMKNIGTGEGAQAYGHGLYFAGNEGVARAYRDALSGPGALKFPTPELEAAAAKFPELYGWLGSGGNPAPMIKHLKGLDYFKSVNGIGKNPEKAAALKILLENFQPPVKIPAGNMYEVSLRTEPERLLDWDKPLSAQPKEVQKALFGPSGVVTDFRGNRHVQDLLDSHVNDDFEGLTGNQFHGVLNHLAQSDLLPTNGPGVLQALERGQTKPAAAAFLRNEGLDGIRYLDGNSRLAGDGSRNYVMFDDKLIDVLRRYGLGGAAIGAGNALIPGEQ